MTLFVTGLIGSLKRALRTFIRIQGDSCVLITGTPTQRYNEVQIIMGLDKIGPGNPRVFRQSYRSQLAQAESAATTETSEIRQIEQELSSIRNATAAFDEPEMRKRFASIRAQVRTLTERMVRNQTRCCDERGQRTALLDELRKVTKDRVVLQAEFDAFGSIAEPTDAPMSDAAVQAEEERHRQWEDERLKRIGCLQHRIDCLNRMLEPLASDEPPDAEEECRSLQSRIAALERSVCFITESDLDEARADAANKRSALVRLEAKAEQIPSTVLAERMAEEQALEARRSDVLILKNKVAATLKPTDQTIESALEDTGRSKSALDRVGARLEQISATADLADLTVKRSRLLEHLASFADVSFDAKIDMMNPVVQMTQDHSNPVENYLKDKQIKLSVHTLSRRLKLSKRAIRYHCRFSNKLRQINPLEVGSRKAKVAVFGTWAIPDDSAHA